MMNDNNIEAKLFEPANITDNNTKLIHRSLSFWEDVWIRFKSNKGAIIGLFLVLAITILSIILPLVSDYTYQEQNTNILNEDPSSEHYLGTDGLGRDLWTRVWVGARISMSIALLAVLIDIVVGVTYGSISGYFGGKVDIFMQRIIEILMGIPNLIVIILLLLVFEPGVLSIAVAMGLTGWIGMARIVRAQMLKLKSQEYVLAARTLGASHKRVLFKHLIPNVMGPIIVAVTFSIPSAIFFEAFLSYIGLGIRPPGASLGVLLNDGTNVIMLYPYQVMFPAILISAIMLAFNLIGDGLRDALDPKLRK